MSCTYFFSTWLWGWSSFICSYYLRLWAVKSILKINLIILNFCYFVFYCSILPNNILSITHTMIGISISTCLWTYFRLSLLNCTYCISFVLIRFSLFLTSRKRVLHVKKIFRAMLLSLHILLADISSSRGSINSASYLLNVFIDHINILAQLNIVCIIFLLNNSSIICYWSI